MDHTITDLKTRLKILEGDSYPHNTTISYSETSSTRESRNTNTSGLTDYTNPNYSVPYTRPQKTRHNTNNCATRTYSRSNSPQWESPPHPHPTDDYTATRISPDEILLWSEETLTTHEKPSARYFSRILQVPLAIAEHNMPYTYYTTYCDVFSQKKLRGMVGSLPRHMTTSQQATLHNLATYLRTTSYFDLGYSLSRQGDSAAPQNIWPVTTPLCDPASHL